MKCGKPVRQEQEYCWDCRKQQHLFDQGRAAFTYSDGLPDALFRMKFQNRRDYLDFFADAMVWSSRGMLQQWKPQVIVPVPMYWRKQGRRGYNQAELLAERISQRTGIPLDRKMLRCIRMNSEQKRLSRQERQKNLKDSFQVCSPLTGVERVLIVDDVYTTGSTMDELAGILKKSGVKNVYFLVLCIGKR